MKKILLLLVLPIISFAASDLAIYKSPTHMSFLSNEFNAVVPNYMVNKSVREMKPEKLAAILESGNGYLTFKECSDGEYAVDLQGRVKGAGLAGGLAAYVIVKLAPAIVIVPTAAFLYTGKAIAHVKGGPAMGDAYQKTVIDPLLPRVIDYSFEYADKIAPYVAAVTGVTTPV